MTLYVLIAAFVGIIAGFLIAILSKKTEGVTYGKLDKAGIVTNIVFIPLYLICSPFFMIIGMFSYPDYDGLLGLIGWVVAIIIASVVAFCGLGLGFSVALRKKGKSKLSFAVQFAGLASMAVALLLFIFCHGNLLSSLN